MSAIQHDARAGNSAGARQYRRIVVLDGATLDPGDNPWDAVASLGSLEVHARTAREQLVERALGAEVLLTNKTVLDEAAFAVLPGLRLVAVLATGVNVVDLAAASRHRVTVCNAPGYSVDAVSQHVFALLLDQTNAVAEHANAVRVGEWASAPDFCFTKRPLRELAGLTMGIVGHGRIGARVGEMAHAFGMKVLAFSPSRSIGAAYDGFSLASIERILMDSNVVTLHCPLTTAKRHFVNRALLATG